MLFMIRKLNKLALNSLKLAKIYIAVYQGLDWLFCKNRNKYLLKETFYFRH